MLIPNQNLPGGMTYIPDPQPEDETCPECGKKENILTICKHCGHVYEEEKSSLTRLDVLFLICIVWVIITVIFWLMNVGTGEDVSLFEMFVEQWDFVKKLRIW